MTLHGWYSEMKDHITQQNIFSCKLLCHLELPDLSITIISNSSLSFCLLITKSYECLIGNCFELQCMQYQYHVKFICIFQCYYVANKNSLGIASFSLQSSKTLNDNNEYCQLTTSRHLKNQKLLKLMGGGTQSYRFCVSLEIFKVGVLQYWQLLLNYKLEPYGF